LSPDFSRRADTPELMDDATTGYEEFRDCLVDLAKVNRVTLTHRPILKFLDRLRKSGLAGSATLRIVDVGSGYGDLLRLVDRWAERRGIAVELIGVDLNPWSARSAAEATKPGRPIRWVTTDIFDFDAGGPIDVVISSQFTHHLTDAQLERFLAWAEQTALRGWFISDLHRHWLPYRVFPLLSWLARWHYFVRHDGLISITRAFVFADWRALLDAAGLGQVPVRLTWAVPFRICLERVKPA
jgi:SAM-dependent methyltransferase